MLSRSNEYAIRALTHLARDRSGRLYLAREIAEELDMPAPFLGKVLQPLVAKGILHSQRGRSGGFRLARLPAEVHLIDIVEAQESLGPENVCLLGQHACDDATACPMHEYWKKASSAFRERISKTTLADLVLFADAHPQCVYPHQEKAAAPARPTLMMGVRSAV